MGWNVKIAAILGFISLIATTITYLVDGNPATNPDWGILISTGTALYALLFVRQNNVSSEGVRATGTKVE